MPGFDSLTLASPRPPMPWNDPEKRAAYLKRYYQRNRARLLEYHRKYAERNRESVKEYKRKWFSRNRERIRDRRREVLYPKNREKILAQNRIYKKRADVEKRKAYYRDRYQRNLQRIREMKKRYYHENKEQGAVKRKQWRSANRDRVRAREKKNYQKHSQLMTDRYVMETMRGNMEIVRGLPVSPDMIKAKRATLRVKRLLRNIKETAQCQEQQPSR